MAKNQKLRLEELIENPTFIQWAKGEKSSDTEKWGKIYESQSEVQMVMEDARTVAK